MTLIERLETARGHNPELDRLFAAATGYRNHFTGQLLSDALADPDPIKVAEAMRWEGYAGLTDNIGAVLALVGRLVSSRHPGWTYNCQAVFGSRGPWVRFEITWPSTESQGRGTTLARAASAALLRAIERDPAMLVPGAGAPA